MRITFQGVRSCIIKGVILGLAAPWRKSRVRGTHGDEAETAGTAAFAIHDQHGFDDIAVGAERFVQVGFGRVEREVSNVEFTHDDLVVRDSLLLSRDCSRKSGLKSSLNEVHLKIYHALKETSYLPDRSTLSVWHPIAMQFAEKFLSLALG